MAPKAREGKRKVPTPSVDSNGMFAGMVFFLVDNGVQPRRLQIWKQKLMQMGATIEDQLTKTVTHVLAINSKSLLQKLGSEPFSHFKGKVLLYQWLEDSLTLGEKQCEDSYVLKLEFEGETLSDKSSKTDTEERKSSGDASIDHNKIRLFSTGSKFVGSESKGDTSEASLAGASTTASGSEDSLHAESPIYSSPDTHGSPNKSVDPSPSSPQYSPPDLNRNITEIFGKLINIYRAVGDDRRSFSYYKAIPVIEKLPFKIESVDQVKHLPGIGRSMQDHIHEIVTTGKLSKLEHFETDEKVHTISLFGEIWGIGPATALKLYEKGHRTLDDLRNEKSLTHAQRLGLKYFDDIKMRIPRHEVQEMEHLLQKAGEELLPGVEIVCGGSYRRGKASCGDLDIIITHPDGKSHRGFLQKFVKWLKDMNFLREDLIFSTHSEEGTDSGVDTYFGLCTYPGRETRHRIDFKVYPWDIYAFGLIAWTGNDVLNRRLRLLAESKGYLLDDTGLYVATRGSGGKRAKSSKSLSLKTEKEVFDFLGFPWLEPHERNL